MGNHSMVFGRLEEDNLIKVELEKDIELGLVGLGMKGG